MLNPPKKMAQKPEEEKVPETREEEVISMSPKGSVGVGDVVFGADLDHLMNQLVDFMHICMDKSKSNCLFQLRAQEGQTIKEEILRTMINDD